MASKNIINLLEVPVYYINLDRDLNKRKKIEKTLKRIGFINVTRFPGIWDQTKAVGVAKSHKALLEKLSDTPTPFIVFEDDIDVSEFRQYIEIPDNADAYYLGNSAFGLYDGKGKKKISVKRFDNETHRVYNMLAAHAILYLSNDYVCFLNQAIKFNLSIKTNQDKARAETMKYWNIYTSTHPLFYQSGPYDLVTRVSVTSVRRCGPEGAFVY